MKVDVAYMGKCGSRRLKEKLAWTIDQITDFELLEI